MIILESDMQMNLASRMCTSFSIWQQTKLHEEDGFNFNIAKKLALK